MRKHTELTINRIAKFRKKLKESYYSGNIPMSASYFKTKEPFPFKDAKDAVFEKINPGKKWGSLYDCAWFRFKGEVPEEFAGYEVVALIDVGGEGCLFDIDGNPIQGLTNKRIEWTMKETIIKKRIYLFSEAQGGEKVELMVDAGANNILGVENVLTYESMEDGVFNQAELVIFDREKWSFYIEYDLLTNLMEDIPPASRHHKLLVFALNECINTYGSGTSEEVAACREILKKELDRKANASSIEASAIGHAHIDIAWLWPLRETVRKAARTFSTALLLMNEYPDYKFGASQPVLYQMMKDTYPGLYQRIKDAIKRGQWECQGAMWVEADCNLSSGESLVRQIIHGKKFFKEEFDIEVDNLWLPDVFGYSSALPQLLIKSDVNYFMTQKISWNQFNTFPHHTFIWKGIDGTEIFSHFLAPNNYRSDVSAQDLRNLERKNFDTERSEYALFLYGAGDGGGGPSRIYIEKLKRAESLEGLPRVKMEFASEYFKKAAEESRDLQKWDGELYLELHRGTLTTHALTKKLNRKVELLLREVEMYYGLYYNDEYPKEALDRLWKVLLLNQFHDIIPGTSVTQVHLESIEQYTQTKNELESLIAKAETHISEKVNNELFDKGYLLVNSLNWNRKSIVELPFTDKYLTDVEGNILPQQVVEKDNKKTLLIESHIPSCGHTIIGESSETEVSVPQNLIFVTDLSIENPLIKVVFDEEDGRILNIYDKEARRDVLANGEKGNAFKIYKDEPLLWDAWDVDIYYEEVPPERPTLSGIKILEQGPLRASIQFDYEDMFYAITQIVSIEAFSKRIDFKTKINWQETDKMLRVEFPVNILSRQATFDIQYGYVQRTTHYNTSWDMAQFEVVAHKWADISQSNYGVALLNDCKYGHKIKGNTISLNLLRSPKNPDPLADMHIHEFTYSLFPHLNDHVKGKVPQEAYELNIPTRTIPIKKQKGIIPEHVAYLETDRYNIIIESVKQAEYTDELVVRLYESSGVDCYAYLKVSFDYREVKLVNIMERDLDELETDGNIIKLFFKPFEIHTIKFTM
ncbi:alpha-mannosidase [Chondrinema litorale]|uniref:alpha-mannosidase n=1 Tax=Chondrinema litorale TaxID=2994555 RepID=UPI002543FA06|nr:glycoside hydrolase family 38 C-terminal domain-containing protein [Chondrinema litorale]UZR94569.1 glycosyl hydrolase-related protein [Chondrinema litorale]